MKKFLVLAMVSIVALATLGVGYALWFEVLSIDGTVSTGTVIVELSGPDIYDVEALGKDVGKCVNVPTQDPTAIQISVTDAYPSYECYVTFDVHSLGTIPVHVQQPFPDAGNPGWVALQDCYVDGAGTPIQGVPQLHEGEAAYCTIFIHFDNDEAAAMGWDGSTSGQAGFGFTVGAHQFNEGPPSADPNNWPN